MMAVLMISTGLSATSAPNKPSKLPAPTGRETIVEDQPEGKLTLYSRDCRGFREFNGTVEQVIDEGSVVKMVEQEDGTVWLHNVISQYPVPGWIKAEKEDDMLVIRGPQLVYEEYDYDLDDGSYLKYFVSPVEMQYYTNEDGIQMIHYEPSEDGVFTFKIDGDRLVEYYMPDDNVQNGSLILGLVNYNKLYHYFFTGYGDNYIVMNLPEKALTEIPETAEVHEKWAMKYDYYDFATWNFVPTANFVDVAVDGKDYYIKGIYPSIPDVWVKGTLEGKTITFPNFQMIGPNEEYNYFVYLCGGQLMESDYYEGVMDAVIDTDGFALTLESDGNLYAETNIIFATSPRTDLDNANFLDYFEAVEIMPQDPNAFTDPEGPYEMYIGSFDGEANIEFGLSAMDVDGNILDENNLYFSVYVNNEIFTFTQESYKEELMALGIKGSTTELPYNIGNNGMSFYQSLTWHTVYIVGIALADIKDVGIQTIYYPEGKDVNPDNVLRSKIYFVEKEDDPNSIESIDASNIMKVEFFDTQGRKVANPEKGIYVKTVTLTDGSVKTSKVALK